ncbi:hypothetical protein BR93DRAFT_191580 [Coniochaeta sp. PMI_546]|nr:hypothetical protein BR93DRAFT_191580 [Coniochaeta sp. PMI_546]
MFAASNLFAGGRLDRDSTTMDYLCVMEAAWTKAVELLYDGDWSSEGVDFASVLLETSGRTCSDPRDRVYALYEFAPALQRVCPPDYSKPVQQVMHDTAIYLARTGCLYVHMYHSLHEDRLRTGIASSAGLPSLVPDLTRSFVRITSPGESPKNSPHQFFCRSLISLRLKTFGSNCEVSAAGRVLELRARKLGDFHCLVRFSHDLKQVVNQIIDLLVLLRDKPVSVSHTRPWSSIRTDAHPNLDDRLTKALLEDETRDPHISSGEGFLKELYRLQKHLRTANRRNRVTRQSSVPYHELWPLESRLFELRGKVVFTVMGCVGLTVGDAGEHDDDCHGWHTRSTPLVAQDEVDRIRRGRVQARWLCVPGWSDGQQVRGTPSWSPRSCS